MKSVLYAHALLLLVLFATTATGAGNTEGTTITFRFRAPEGTKTVTVSGTFNSWNSIADALGDIDEDGIWETTLQISQGTYHYKFVVNGTDWYTDEFATEFIQDGFGGRNSVLMVGSEPMIVGEPHGETLGNSGTEVMFRYKPSFAHLNSVSLAGTFNSWNAAAHPMAFISTDGGWEITLRLAPGHYAYQFVADGHRWFTDDFANDFENDGFGGRNALLNVGISPVVVGYPEGF